VKETVELRCKELNGVVDKGEVYGWTEAERFWKIYPEDIATLDPHEHECPIEKQYTSVMNKLARWDEANGHLIKEALRARSGGTLRLRITDMFRRQIDFTLPSEASQYSLLRHTWYEDYDYGTDYGKRFWIPECLRFLPSKETPSGFRFTGEIVNSSLRHYKIRGEKVSDRLLYYHAKATDRSMDFVATFVAHSNGIYFGTWSGVDYFGQPASFRMLMSESPLSSEAVNNACSLGAFKGLPPPSKLNLVNFKRPMSEIDARQIESLPKVSQRVISHSLGSV